MITELEAINTMLTCIGSAPVNTITGALSADVAVALHVLEESKKDTLLQGWSWNRDYDVALYPQLDGRIPVPTNTLRIDLAQSKQFTDRRDPVQRGAYLYDRDSKTYTFGSSILVDRLVDLEWDDIPEAAQRYITAKAARVFVGRMDAGQERYQYAAQDEAGALSALRSHETETGDYSIYDPYTSQHIVRRGL